MGSISAGISAIAKAFVGTNDVVSIWLGDKKVYESSPAPSGNHITIHINGTYYEYFMTEVTLSVDGTDYSITSTFGDWSTDFPSNGVPIQASTVSIDGAYYRWKDSNTSTWQNREPKTWTNMPDGFEIWIEVPMEE